MTQKGYTLIEVMITIALVAILAMVGLPMTGGWVQSADLEETQGKLMEAIGRAKASGLRNPAGKLSTDYVAIVCISTISNKLKVMESTAATAADCTASNAATLLWESRLDSDVSIVDSSNSAISCLCTNNKGGLVQTASGTCSTCYSGADLKLQTGSKELTTLIF